MTRTVGGTDQILNSSESTHCKSADNMTPGSVSAAKIG